MNLRRRIALAGIAAALATVAVYAALPAARQQAQSPFPHDKHAKLFPLCSTCHAGVTEPGAALWPGVTSCVACHDSVVRPRVAWAPRSGPHPGNLRFTHALHDSTASAKNAADSALVGNCASCHNQPGAPRMTVHRAVVQNCLECHRLPASHVDLPPAACATCHVPLSAAPGLTTADIARFPRPADHDAPDFVLSAHGKAATVSTAAGAPTIAASCATCHARNLCIACHVDAPESRVIQSLALDARAPAYALETHPVPASHSRSDFIRTHGREAQRATATCATCHTRASCTTCHVGNAPRIIASLPVAGPGRAVGADPTRRAPVSHAMPDFREGHGPEASARPATCETCHQRSFCLECHRPDGAGSERARSEGAASTAARTQLARPQNAPRSSSRPSSYHPQGFLTRHPSSAYSREANCSDCHNPAQFCQSCHQQSGLTANARLGPAGYHDAFRGFNLGHGQAARQSLETCVGCHTERDCTACHSAVGGGFRFSPHGPGFNAARARAKNPAVCIACHGTAIPGGR